MMVSFVLSFFPRDVLDEFLNLIESVSEDFPSYSFIQSEKCLLWSMTQNPPSLHIFSIFVTDCLFFVAMKRAHNEIYSKSNFSGANYVLKT